MAIPTPVDAQITDSVTQASLSVTGSTAAMAVSQSRQVAAQAVALLMANATPAQQRGQTARPIVEAARDPEKMSVGGQSRSQDQRKSSQP